MKIEPTCPDCGCTEFSIDDRSCVCASCGWQLLPDGYIYLIRSSEVPVPFNQWGSVMYKVGRSKNPELRLKQHKSRLWQHDLELIHTIPTNNMKETERELHATLEKMEGAMNVRGEWYILDDAVLNWLKSGYVFFQEWRP